MQKNMRPFQKWNRTKRGKALLWASMIRTASELQCRLARVVSRPTVQLCHSEKLKTRLEPTAISRVEYDEFGI